MKTIYLIRHGKPDFPDGHHMCLGRTDLPLSREGLVQAEAAAEQLKDVELSVFSSPLIRCRQTAQALNRPVSILEDLAELDMGQWDGLTFDEIRARYPELYAARGLHPELLPPGAEPPAAGLLRFRNALLTAAELTEGNLAAVTHGGVISLLLEQLCGSRYKPGYGEITVIHYEKGNFYYTRDYERA